MIQPKRKPKILFIIFNYTHGRGGHYFSLQSTILGLANVVDPHLLVIGGGTSTVLDELRDLIPIHYCKSMAYYSSARQLKKILIQHEIEVVHAFDREAFLVARVCSLLFGKISIVYTKCGGANPRYYHPLVNNIVLYSAENESYFSSKNLSRGATINLIPNRIHEVSQDNQLISEMLAVLQDGHGVPSSSKIMLRICRFSGFHKSSLVQTIEFFEKLRASGLDIVLVLVGTIQNIEVFEEIRTLAGEKVFIFSEDKFTKRASQILNFADVVVGTGRGFMEGAVLGKIMLLPSDRLERLVLVHRGNIDLAFKYNFSARSPLVNDGDCSSRVSNLFHSKEKRFAYQSFMKEFGFNRFLVSSVEEKYVSLYSSVRSKKSGILEVLDIIFHYISAVVLRYRRFKIIRL